MEAIPEPEPATSGTGTPASHHSLAGTRPIGWWALPPVLGLFAVIWGPAAAHAVRLRLTLSPGQPPPAHNATDLDALVATTAALVLATAYWRLRELPSGTPTAWPHTVVSTGWQACAYMLIINLGFVAGSLLAATGWLTRLPVVGEEISYPVTEPSLADLLYMTLAGPLEELALVGIPLLLFGRGRGLAAFCAILMVLRVSFHVYYGISTTVGLLLWASLALWMYTSSARILPLVLGHSVNNLLSFLILDAPPGSASSTTFKAAKVALIGAGAVCALWVLHRRAARHQQATEPGGGVDGLTATGAVGARPASLRQPGGSGRTWGESVHGALVAPQTKQTGGAACGPAPESGPRSSVMRAGVVSADGPQVCWRTPH